ncbi:TonB-dependent receptor plug domain-containing protein [Niabella pedocola]|uniref:TonB-dependent receptor plug domain-containing protein n=1 Tax=Niabella pedocola TaxID=1752077 RepID=A0ABS8PW10_9BACT|nr:TonB-dependent receptor plug domain-containing protein [Niabella pedocola]MCD2425259.1 TonB-dependent receptor plug domain-containing protein [Niabella pedocola]
MRYLILFFFLLNTQVIAAQETDSVKTIDPVTVTVRAFQQKEDITTAVVRRVEYAVPSSKSALVTAMNTIAGVRMEERSPGSYRINIRGSSLRSPFGVRNVKVYWGGIPLTDPGGNTYFNQLAFNNFNAITIFKGPASSMYGAGTGGLILIDPPAATKSGGGVEYFTGTYNAHHLLAEGTLTKDNYINTVTYAHDQSDGYRAQSAMQRNNFSWNTRMKWKNQELIASVLFSDLYYQTPGALTLQEYQQNPQAARPKAGAFPGAEQINAAIWQKTLTAGVTHKQKFGPYWSNTTTGYGAYALVKNSAVRNFEQRKEPHFGGRTVFDFDRKWGSTGLQWSTGLEAQQGYSTIRVSDNRNGRPDTLQTDDDVTISTYSIFTQGILSWKSWSYTAGVSLNRSRLQFTRLNAYPVTEQVFRYNNEVAPRFTVLKKFGPVDLLGTVSRGFSPPTVAEVLPSTTIINPDLKAEHGWNYELTARKSLWKGQLHLEATGFYFNLSQALVQRRDSSGADYFTNAGNIRQKGAELYANYIHFFPTGLLNYLNITANYAHSHFKYSDFMKTGQDYSGKWVPGVPMNTLNTQLGLALKPGIYTDVNYYTAAAIFLNDANAAQAPAYHLLGIKLGYRKPVKAVDINVYAGVDNLFNETYSLGNDINAAGGRYYNAAPLRNYYLGAAIGLRRH